MWFDIFSSGLDRWRSTPRPWTSHVMIFHISVHLHRAWRTNQHVAHVGIAFVISLWVSIHKYYKRWVYFSHVKSMCGKSHECLQVRRLVLIFFPSSFALIIMFHCRKHSNTHTSGGARLAIVIWRHLTVCWLCSRPLFYSHFHGSVYRCGFSLIFLTLLYFESNESVDDLNIYDIVHRKARAP